MLSREKAFQKKLPDLEAKNSATIATLRNGLSHGMTMLCYDIASPVWEYYRKTQEVRSEIKKEKDRVPINIAKLEDSIAALNNAIKAAQPKLRRSARLQHASQLAETEKAR